MATRASPAHSRNARLSSAAGGTNVLILYRGLATIVYEARMVAPEGHDPKIIGSLADGAVPVRVVIPMEAVTKPFVAPLLGAMPEGVDVEAALRR